MVTKDVHCQHYNYFIYKIMYIYMYFSSQQDQWNSIYMNYIVKYIYT